MPGAAKRQRKSPSVAPTKAPRKGPRKNTKAPHRDTANPNANLDARPTARRKTKVVQGCFVYQEWGKGLRYVVGLKQSRKRVQRLVNYQDAILVAKSLSQFKLFGVRQAVGNELVPGLPYEAFIIRDGHPCHVGYFQTPQQAAQAHDIAALKDRATCMAINDPENREHLTQASNGEKELLFEKVYSTHKKPTSSSYRDKFPYNSLLCFDLPQPWTTNFDNLHLKSLLTLARGLELQNRWEECARIGPELLKFAAKMVFDSNTQGLWTMVTCMVKGLLFFKKTNACLSFLRNFSLAVARGHYFSTKTAGVNIGELPEYARFGQMQEDRLQTLLYSHLGNDTAASTRWEALRMQMSMLLAKVFVYNDQAEQAHSTLSQSLTLACFQNSYPLHELVGVVSGILAYNSSEAHSKVRFLGQGIQELSTALHNDPSNSVILADLTQLALSLQRMMGISQTQKTLSQSQSQRTDMSSDEETVVSGSKWGQQAHETGKKDEDVYVLVSEFCDRFPLNPVGYHCRVKLLELQVQMTEREDDEFTYDNLVEQIADTVLSEMALDPMNVQLRNKAANYVVDFEGNASYPLRFARCIISNIGCLTNDQSPDASYLISQISQRQTPRQEHVEQFMIGIGLWKSLYSVKTVLATVQQDDIKWWKQRFFSEVRKSDKTIKRALALSFEPERDPEPKGILMVLLKLMAETGIQLGLLT
mmetsp:Transcript_35469/g.56737  ORF Transcript_35469/g.56737 Transcript_35469/m.56737 type:complete len:702 (-) Transcript_35469:8-2113(-)